MAAYVGAIHSFIKPTTLKILLALPLAIVVGASPFAEEELAFGLFVSHNPLLHADAVY